MNIPATDRKRALFRAEASAGDGLGHMVRCLGMAEGMLLDGPPAFALRTQPGWREATGPLADAGWNVHELDPDLSDEDDAGATAALARQLKSDLVITDLCHQKFLEDPERLARYHTKLRQEGAPFVLSIEDCRMTRFTSNAAIIPYDCPPGQAQRETANGCRLYEGLEYYICRKEFTEAARAPREIHFPARHILVSVGGGDPTGLTIKIAKAIMSLGDQSLEFRIFLGLGADDKVHAATAGHPGAEVRPYTDDMAGEMLWADLLITGEGLTRFEAALTGTPSLTISQFEHDSDVLKYFYGRGTTRYAGAGDALSVSDLASLIQSLLDDKDARAEQSRTGKEILDGRGMERIAAEILANIQTETQAT